MTDAAPLGKLDAILAWPEPVASLDGQVTSWVLTDPFTLNRIVLSGEEARIVEVLQSLQGAARSAPEVAALVEARHGLGVGVEAVERVVAHLGRLGFYAGMDFPSRFGHQQWHLAQHLDALALQAADRLVQFAARHIPFYRRHLGDPPRIESHEDLRRLPTVGKALLRAGLPELLPEAGAAHLGLMWQSTSGTTGDRLQVPHDGAWFERGLMATHAMNPVTARRTLGHPFAILTPPVCRGTECHMLMELPYEQRLWGGGYCLYLNSTVDPTRFGEAALDAMLDDLRRLGPKSLNVDAAYAVALARHVLAGRPSDLPRLDAITVSFEVASALHKATLSEAFGCPVFEDYSANEVGAIGLECPSGTVHVPADYAIVELLDRDGEPVGPGAIGRVHLTTLKKSAMPLIRYATGDLAQASAGPCHCGSPHPGFRRIEGRAVDCIVDAEGRPVTPRQVDDVVAEHGAGIGWYTLAQTAARAWSLRVVPLPGAGEDAGRSAAEALSARLGGPVGIETVRELRPAASGKFRLCFQETPIVDVEALF